MPTRPKGLPVWETIAIFVAIASLWPAYILGWAEPVWQWLSYLALGVMLCVFVRRTMAFRRLAREAQQERERAAKEGKDKPVRLPWEPPPPSGS